MIGSESEALFDREDSERAPTRLGGPLAVFTLILTAWITGRVALWEDPFAIPNPFAEAGRLLVSADTRPNTEIVSVNEVSFAGYPFPAKVDNPSKDNSLLNSDQGPGLRFDNAPLYMAPKHHMLWRAAMTSDFRGVSWQIRQPGLAAKSPRQANVPVFPGQAGVGLENSAGKQARNLNRWSLGAWAFFREGSNSAPIAQGRVPVYGASQIGATLQYRAAPGSGHDPRLYLRAYRALIEDPETEIAAGISAKPSRKVPLRVAAELRATDNEFRRDVRPAVYAITEIPPVSLPLGLSAEVYAGTGYVGGEARTAFIDGQASILREVARFDLRKVDDVRVSFGAGTWGGAQRDANRIDVGPTMRVDLSLGAVPARLSINYRERVGGDAAPESGVAATISTQF